MEFRFGFDVICVFVVCGIMLMKVIVTVGEEMSEIVQLMPRAVCRSHDMRMIARHVRRARVRSAEVHTRAAVGVVVSVGTERQPTVVWNGIRGSSATCC